MIPGTFESLRADLGLTYAAASSAFVAIAIGAIAGTGATVAADYCSRRLIATTGAIGYAAALLVIGSARSSVGLLVGSFVLGAASTALVDATEIALADVAGPDLERHLTTQNFLASLGDLIGPAVVIGVAGLGLSWRMCFSVTALVVLAYAVWLARFPFPPPPTRDHDHRFRVATWSVVRDPAVWLAGLVSLLLGPLDEPLIAFLIAHLEEARGLTQAGATTIATLSVIGAFAAYPALRQWPARLPVDGGLFAVAATGMVVAPDATTAAIATLAGGFFLLRVWIDLQTRILQLRPGQTGMVKATITVIETAGWALPVLAGSIADRHGVSAGLAVYAALAWGLAVAGGLLYRTTRARAQSPALAPAEPS